jgi:hypothetical protein
MPEPKLVALAISEYEGRDGKPQTKWTRIGVAFRNRDGSHTVELDALPVASGNPPRTRIQIREQTEQDGGQRDDRGPSRDRR